MREEAKECDERGMEEVVVRGREVAGVRPREVELMSGFDGEASARDARDRPPFRAWVEAVTNDDICCDTAVTAWWASLWLWCLSRAEV